ncbi:ISL3 family transposase [Tannockella kyphosi]|uniref:ISL3 family transposase n=1 Tax=Tannockella kyphosi TaxID=2899121 RepID=UPI0020110694|nr:ISL3 family transposase [Tannockella kyphosi]
MNDDTLTMSICRDDILQLFNLEAKRIDTFEIRPTLFNELEIHVKLSRCYQTCPCCHNKTNTVKDYVPKKITHSLLHSKPTYIFYNARRYRCKICGKSFYEENPFTHEKARISALTVYNVIEEFKSPRATFSDVAARYHISTTSVINLFDQHVSVSRKTLPRYLCLDENYAFKYDKSNYCFVLVDLLTKDVVDILPSRKKLDLLRYFEAIPLEEREGVELVVSDCWKTYRDVAKKMLPNSKFVVDKYHILADLTKRVDRIRIDVMNENYVKISAKELDALPPDKKAEIIQKKHTYYVLKKFNWLIHTNHKKKKKRENGKIIEYYALDPNNEKKYNYALSKFLNFYDLYDLVYHCDPRLTEAVELKESLVRFYKQSTYKNAKHNLDEVIKEFEESTLPDMRKYASTLKEWKKGIIHSFIPIDSPVPRTATNAIIENRNKLIKDIKRGGNGFRCWPRFRNRILFALNSESTMHLNPIKKEKQQDT